MRKRKEAKDDANNNVDRMLREEKKRARLFGDLSFHDDHVYIPN